MKPRFKDANHPPRLRLNGVAGDAPVEIAACPGEPVHLSALGSGDPDGQPLTFRWWQYREPSGIYGPAARIEGADGPDAVVTVSPVSSSPKAKVLTTYKVHVILEATDGGSPALTRYRRAVISLPGAEAFARSGKACPSA